MKMRVSDVPNDMSKNAKNTNLIGSSNIINSPSEKNRFFTLSKESFPE
jgi:hypothetical protein